MAASRRRSGRPPSPSGSAAPAPGRPAPRHGPRRPSPPRSTSRLERSRRRPPGRHAATGCGCPPRSPSPRTCRGSAGVSSPATPCVVGGGEVRLPGATIRAVRTWRPRHCPAPALGLRAPARRPRATRRGASPRPASPRRWSAASRWAPRRPPWWARVRASRRAATTCCAASCWACASRGHADPASNPVGGGGAAARVHDEPVRRPAHRGRRGVCRAPSAAAGSRRRPSSSGDRDGIRAAAVQRCAPSGTPPGPTCSAGSPVPGRLSRRRLCPSDRPWFTHRRHDRDRSAPVTDHVEVRAGAYYDSVSLMQVSRQVASAAGVAAAQVAMATELNLEVIARHGLLRARTVVQPNDLVVAIRADDDDGVASGLAALDSRAGRPQGRPAPGPAGFGDAPAPRTSARRSPRRRHPRPGVGARVSTPRRGLRRDRPGRLGDALLRQRAGRGRGPAQGRRRRARRAGHGSGLRHRGRGRGRARASPTSSSAGRSASSRPRHRRPAGDVAARRRRGRGEPLPRRGRSRPLGRRGRPVHPSGARRARRRRGAPSRSSSSPSRPPPRCSPTSRGMPRGWASRSTGRRWGGSPRPHGGRRGLPRRGGHADAALAGGRPGSRPLPRPRTLRRASSRTVRPADSDAADCGPARRYLRGLFCGGTLADEAMLVASPSWAGRASGPTSPSHPSSPSPPTCGPTTTSSSTSATTA